MEASRVFEDVFRRMVATFAAELSTGDWSVFKTEKHIIMEISAIAPKFSSFNKSPPSPVASTSHSAQPPEKDFNFRLESVRIITLDNNYSANDSVQEEDPPASSGRSRGSDSRQPSVHDGDNGSVRQKRDKLHDGFSIFPESSFQDLNFSQSHSSFSTPPAGGLSSSMGLDSDGSMDSDSYVEDETSPFPLVPAHKTIIDSQEDLKPFQRKAECPKCHKIFANRRHLTRHLKTIHLGLKHKCVYCGGLYARADGLRNHINSVHIDEVLKRRGVQQAEKMSPVVVPIAIEGRRDGGKRDSAEAPDREGEAMGLELWSGPPPSSEAGETLPPVSHANSMIPWMPPGAMNPFSPALFGGQKNRNQRGPRSESFCAKKIERPDGRSLYQCPYCFEEFDSPEFLQQHMKASHKGKIHLCQICLTLYISPWKLRRHWVVHRKEFGIEFGGGEGAVAGDIRAMGDGGDVDVGGEGDNDGDGGAEVGLDGNVDVDVAGGDIGGGVDDFRVSGFNG